MKRKEFWDYSGRNEPSKRAKIAVKPARSRFRNRLGDFLLIGSCCAAAAVVIISLFFYFFPAQAAGAADSVETFADNLLTPNTEHYVRRMKDISFTPGSKAYLRIHKGELNIPTLVLSNRQGDVSQIGELGAAWTAEADYQVMLNTAMGPMLYYNQADSHWGDYLYGGMDPMRQYGCGPTVVAMLVNAFTETPVNPLEMADWCAANGYYAPQSGSYHSIILNALSAHGLKVESAAGISHDTAVELLRSGHVLVALMGKGTFSNGGHFIIITNILENGNVCIADCGNYNNTTMEWNLDQILAELKSATDGGGPLWSVGFAE